MKKIVQNKYLFVLFLTLFSGILFAQDQSDLTSTVGSNNKYVSAGDTMTVNSRVNNIGNYAVDESYVHFYLSADDVYDIADTFLDSLRYGRVIGKSSKQTSVDLIIPEATPFGDYYIVAYVDKIEQIDETDETNNESSVTITISSFDLTAINITATPNPVSVLEEITFEFDIINQSGSFIPSNHYKIYLSEDTIINSGDTELRSSYAQNLSGSTVAISQSLNIGDCLSSGVYYLLLSVDDDSEIPETNEDNNFNYHEIVIIEATTDLSVPYSGNIENSTFLQDNVLFFSGFSKRSAGKISAPSSDVKIYWSMDETLDEDDALIYSELGDALTCGSSVGVSGSIIITDTVSFGQKYLIAVIDPDGNVVEDDETNNTKVISFWVAESIDLSISSCSVVPAEIIDDQDYTINFTIQNEGATPLGNVNVRLSCYQYIGQDTILIGSLYNISHINSMNPGEQEIISGTYWSNSIFNYYNYVDVLSISNVDFVLETYVGGQDDVQSECSTLVSANLDVDYYLDNVRTNKKEYEPGEDITVTTSITTTELYDLGTYADTDQDISFYFSDDPNYDVGDVLLGTFGEIFSTNSNYVKDFTLDNSLGGDDYFIIVKIDAGSEIAETDETNNEFVRPIYVSGPTITESQTDGDWMGIDWSNGIPDGESFKIIISSEVTLNQNADGKSLTIMPGGKLTLNGGLSISDTAVLKSNDTGDASLKGQANLTASGAIIAERYISRYTSSSNGWHFLSSPVSNFTISGSNFAPVSGSEDLYRWGEATNEWLNYTGGTFSHTEFEVGLGYLVGYNNSETKRFSGTLNASSYTKELSFTEGEDTGWNFLGNPYTSAILWDELTKTAGVDGSVYMVDPSNGTYNSWNGSAGNIVNGEIPVNQAFFVKANSAGQSVTIKTAAQVHSASNFSKSTKAATETLKVNLKGINSNNNTYLQFREDATADFDHQIDAYKLFGFAEIAQVYTELEETQFAINCLPYATETISVPLAIRVLTDENLAFNFFGIESFDASIRIDLEDLKTGEITNIRTNPAYTFQAITSDDANRFILHFNGVTAVEDIKEEQAPLVYSFNDVIYIQIYDLIDAEIVVYNINGQIVGQDKLRGKDLKRLDLNLSTGIYMVSIKTTDAVYTEKVMIK